MSTEQHMNEHEKYLFLHGAVRGLKLRLERALGDDPATSPALFDAHELREILDTINAMLKTVETSASGLQEAIKAALVERGWQLDEAAVEAPDGEVRMFVHPETGATMAWLDAVLAEQDRELR